jgi:hypothetical protein
MTVEIRELVIRAVTNLNQGNPGQDQPANPPNQNRVFAGDEEALIQECVKQVLRIIQKAKER